MPRGDVQLAPDSTGKFVTTYQVTRIDPGSGAPITEQQQIISIVDETGNVIDLSGIAIQMRMLRMLQRIAGALEQGMDLGVNLADEDQVEDALEIDNSNTAVS